MLKFFGILRSKLTMQMVLWMALVSLFPLGIGAYINYKNATKQIEQRAMESLIVASERQANEIKEYFDYKYKFLSIISTSFAVKKSLTILEKIDQAEYKQDSSRLEEIRRNFEPGLIENLSHYGFKRIFLMDTKGKINLSVENSALSYSDIDDEGLAQAGLMDIFQKARTLMTPQVSDFFLNPSSNIPGLFLGTPVFSDGRLVGVLVLQIEGRDIYRLVENYNGLGESGEIVIAETVEDTAIILNPLRNNPAIAFSSQGLREKEKALALKQALKGKHGVGQTIDYRGKEVFAAWEHLPQIRWALLVKMDKDEIMRPVEHLKQASLFIVLGVFVIILFIALLLSKSITQPIRSLTDVISQIAEGSLSSKMEKIPKNEIGKLGGAVDALASNLKTLIKQVEKSGDEVAMTIRDSTDTVQQHINAAQEAETASLAITVSARQISITAKELTGTMQEVNEVAQDTALLAESGIDGLQIMETSMEALSDANDAVSTEFCVIQEKADAISGIITTMTKVADQTNLLSLNASIEARKAGDYGKGFKIVAQEVRRLADQVADSTLEIENMIGEMLNAIRNGVLSMRNLSEKVACGVREITTVSNHLGNVIQQVQGLPPRFEMVLQGMESQLGGADKIKESITQLSQFAQKTLNSLEATQEKLDFLSESSDSLKGEVSRFRM